jgi:acetylornithine/N-succinyldiaminopimelate aminotransferase
VAAGDLEALEKRTEAGDVAGILLECVQGEGGVIPLSPEFVKGVAALCEAKDIPLMIDEVQTGNGRTGKLYAYMHYGVQPDIVSTAKGLGGGLPIGACMVSKKMESVLGAGDHGSTYGGNPVACAGAVSVLSRLDDAFLAKVGEKSKKIFDTLTGCEGIESVSGLGMMIGIKTVKPAKEVVAACMEQGVLCLTAKDKVRLLPPLNIPDELLDKALEIIKNNCK